MIATDFLETRVTVDVGKSGVRLRVHPARETHNGPGARPERAHGEASGPYLAELILHVWRQLAPRHTNVRSVVVGTTFLPSASQLDVCQSILQVEWPNAEIVILEDGMLAHAAALGTTGTTASIGTGISVVGVGRDSIAYQLDGWGPELGDRGSAAELGRAGLRLACATLDRTANAPTLLVAAEQWLAMPLRVRSAIELLGALDRVERIASFAQTICALADSGDENAHSLVTESASQVADSCRAMASLIDDPTVVCVGRLVDSPAYRSALEIALRDREMQQREPMHAALDAPFDLINRRPYQLEARRLPLMYEGGS